MKKPKSYNLMHELSKMLAKSGRREIKEFEKKHGKLKSMCLEIKIDSNELT